MACADVRVASTKPEVAARRDMPPEEPHKIARCESASRGSSSQASAEWHSSRMPSPGWRVQASTSWSSEARDAAASFPDDAYASRRRRPLRGAVGRRRGGEGAQAKRRGGRSACASGQVLIGFLEPLTDRAGIERLAERGVHAFAMESIPRITRAQPMDALSSQATVSGYKAVLIAADRLPRFFPMLMTAAGTVAPAKVLVVGAGRRRPAGDRHRASPRRRRRRLRRAAGRARAGREPRRDLPRPRCRRRGDRGRLRA